MDKEIKEALEKVLAYMADEEQSDYEESNFPQNHIYRAVVKVQEWLIKQEGE